VTHTGSACAKAATSDRACRWKGGGNVVCPRLWSGYQPLFA